MYLVGCGGSLVTMYSTEYLLERHGAAFPAFLLTSGDFVYRRPAQLGPGSLVVAVSHTGGTAETVEAPRVAREAGATVISVSRHADCPLPGWLTPRSTTPTRTPVTDAKYVLIGHIGLALLARTGLFDHALRGASNDVLPDTLHEVKPRPRSRTTPSRCV